MHQQPAPQSLHSNHNLSDDTNPNTLPFCCPAGTLKCGDYTYTGEWVDDEMHGQGSFSFASGACYEGAWQHNKYQGQGRYCFPDGKAYQVRRQQQRFSGAVRVLVLVRRSQRRVLVNAWLRCMLACRT